MTILLSDLLAPTTLPNTAGAAAPASAKGQDGAFAQELAATQVGTGDATSAGATISAAASATPVASKVQLSPEVREALDTLARTVANETGAPVLPVQVISEEGEVVIASLDLAALAGKLDLDAEIIERIQAGTATSEDIEAFIAAYAAFQAQVPAAPEGTETDGPAIAELAASSAAGAPRPEVQTDPALTPDTADSEEIALKIADEKRPYIPPRPDIPAAPTAKVQEGRAAAALSAPSAPQTPPATPVSIEKDASSVVKTLLETIAPRATANATIAADAAKPVAQLAAQPVVPTPVPPAAQVIANTPYVTSLQASVTASADAAAAPDAPVGQQTAANNAPLPAPASTPASAPVPAPAAAAADAAPATPSIPAPAAPADTAPEAVLTPPPAEGEAVEAAMAVLTKDKADIKADTPQTVKPEAPAPQAKPDAATTDEPELAPKTADTAPKPQDAKPEPKAEAPVKPADKPAVAEKPAGPEPKVQQVQTPVADKPILVDAAARTVQQQMQSLPATAIQHIAGEMAARVSRGHTRFEIRLDPPELGRVDVRIEVDADGKVHSRLMVEKSETLDLLKADQRALERALHDAGFKSDQNTLSFSLKDDRGGHQKFAEQRFLREMNEIKEQGNDPARLVAEVAYRTPMRGPGGIDMRV